MVNKRYVGDGEVVLIAGGGKVYTDVAARFCRSTKGIDDIVNEENMKLVQSIIDSGHNAALEFDDFIFGVNGYSRVTEAQLIRKRHASYMISSGRSNKLNEVDVVYPKALDGICGVYSIDVKKVMNFLIDYDEIPDLIKECDIIIEAIRGIEVILNVDDLLTITDDLYLHGKMAGVSPEDMRYIKPQATTFKGIIKMNACALRDWAKIRMCRRAQSEIRDMCIKMIKLASEASPALFKGVGPNCVTMGYCPEMEQCEEMKGKILTKKQALQCMKENKEKYL